MKVDSHEIRSLTRTMATGSEEFERWWTPMLGPTSTMLAKLSTQEWARGRDDLHQWLGVKPAVLERAADRLVRFRLAERNGDVLMVYSHQSEVPAHLARKLPEPLRALYEATAA